MGADDVVRGLPAQKAPDQASCRLRVCPPHNVLKAARVLTCGVKLEAVCSAAGPVQQGAVPLTGAGCVPWVCSIYAGPSCTQSKFRQELTPSKAT